MWLYCCVLSCTWEPPAWLMSFVSFQKYLLCRQKDVRICCNNSIILKCNKQWAGATTDNDTQWTSLCVLIWLPEFYFSFLFPTSHFCFDLSEVFCYHPCLCIVFSLPLLLYMCNSSVKWSWQKHSDRGRVFYRSCCCLSSKKTKKQRMWSLQTEIIPLLICMWGGGVTSNHKSPPEMHVETHINVRCEETLLWQKFRVYSVFEFATLQMSWFWGSLKVRL